MEIKSCRKCKNLFQYVTGRPICPHCIKEEEKLFVKVKDYLRENQGATMKVVSEETEVPVSLIESFIRAGRLEISANSPLGIPCEVCGIKIHTGRYCNACAAHLTNQFSSMAKGLAVKKESQDSNKAARMRFFDTDK